MTIHPRYVGCDISKQVLDIHDPRTGARRVANTATAAAAFAATLDANSACVVMEATGAYDRTLRHALAEHGVAYVRINPTRARRFAQAAGFLAKTDAVDARMLAALGSTLQPKAETPTDPARAALAQLQKRRDQLVQMRADEKKRRHDADGDLARSIDDHIHWLSRQVDAIDAKIETLVEQTGTLGEETERLRSAPGIGPVTATVLVAEMPELGRLSPRKIASLAGLAPVNHDSGAMRGSRRIKGGRRRVRQALYMAALAAIRQSKRFADFYQRIVERAKAKKVAIIAVARKLLTILNAMVRDKTNYA